MAMMIRRVKRVSKNLVRFLIGLRWTIYYVMSILAFLVMTTGGADKSKALLLIPLAIAISSFYSEIPSACIGFYCGMLTDLACGKLLGVSSLLMVVICCTVSLLYTHLVRKNLINFIWITLCAVLLYTGFDYFFYYKMWDLEGVSAVLKARLLPSVLKTMVSAPAYYFIISVVTRRLGKPERQVLEEQDENIERI